MSSAQVPAACSCADGAQRSARWGAHRRVQAACARRSAAGQDCRLDDRPLQPPPQPCGEYVKEGSQTRRHALAAAAAAAAATVLAPRPAPAAEAVFVQPSSSASDVERTVTHTAYLDVGLCPEAARQDRAVGDKSILCSEPVPLGRITIGLYGNAAPGTVANFLTAVRSGALVGTTFFKVLPGEYVKAGRQGRSRNGALEVPEGLEPNGDLLSGSAFRLTHSRPGTVSLAVGANDDDPYYRERRGYNPMQFIITTGPGPVPSLDGENIVFGRVVEGMDAVAAMAAVPTFSPSGQLRAYNEFASFIGDDRAARARKNWGNPLKALVITGSGVVA